MFARRRRCVKKVENVEEDEEDASSSLLDLPELAVDSILSRLEALELCRAGATCRELRKKCSSNHLWEELVRSKWGSVAGELAFVQWRRSQAAPPQLGSSALPASSSLFWFWPFSCLLPSRLKCSSSSQQQQKRSESVMAWYWALESGSFWFPAQVYNRENGHVGFMLSCYDAEVSYDTATNSFRARYPPHGDRSAVVEERVQWQRVRAPPVATTAHELHISDCLEELQPGDHVEVQWRRSKDFPYGWWYGVVGHAESCDRNNNRCSCRLRDVVWLEFNQYTDGSRWRRAPINRKNHREEGNDAEGFYGGLRKLRSKEEVSIWNKLWPAVVLE